jgi:hypothetical protein
MTLVTLFTDFGAGFYVAQMKGVILSLAPDAVIVDATHEISPGDVLEAAYVVENVVPAFPEESIHVVVVDPGVGTSRKSIVARFARRILVAPDNGVLTAFLPHADEVRELTNEALYLPEVSATFHGRDVFAPVAAQLALGVELEVVGPEFAGPPVSLPELYAAGDEGRVLFVDHFGNLVTNFSAELLSARPSAVVTGPGHRIATRARTFGEAPAGTPFLYAGSGGRLEIALCGGSAAEQLAWTRGTRLELAEGAE